MARLLAKCNGTVPPDVMNRCQTYLFPTDIVLSNETNGCKWSCLDAAAYCIHRQDDMKIWESMSIILKRDPDVHFNVLVPLGLIGNLLLFLTVISRKLKGAVFDFLQCVAFAQLCQGLSVILSRVDWLRLFPEYLKSATGNLDLSQRWIDAVKLNVAVLTFFVSLDRFMAVCTPARYNTMNPRKFFLISCCLAILIGCFELEENIERILVIVSKWPKDNTANVTASSTNSWAIVGVYTNYIRYVILALKMFIFICIITFTTSVVTRLRRRSRQIADMVTAATAQAEHKDMIVMCRFQIVDAIAMCFDLFVSMRPIMDILNKQLIVNLYQSCTFSSKMAAARFITANQITGHILQIFEAFAHGELFILYMLFFGKFRRAFVDVCRKGVKGCKRVIRM